jgi:hypothetical protein
MESIEDELVPAECPDYSQTPGEYRRTFPLGGFYAGTQIERPEAAPEVLFERLDQFHFREQSMELLSQRLAPIVMGIFPVAFQLLGALTGMRPRKPSKPLKSL